MSSCTCQVGPPRPQIYQIPWRFGIAGTTRLLKDDYHIQTMWVYLTGGLEALAYPMKNTVKLPANSQVGGVIASPRMGSYKGQTAHSYATEMQEHFPCRQRYDNS